MSAPGTTPAVPLRELEIRFVRSSGAGGQNVNKVNTKAVLRWPVASSGAIPPEVRERFLERFATRVTLAGDVVLSSDRYRDQGRNAADCVEKLRTMLAAVASPPRPRRPTKPSRASRERRLSEKKARGAVKRTRSSGARED
ncbi:MAG: alternative ribosome rescue aminoacyl-tRNA hydrolase ArfB [Alphaproteobacteria bacterium]